MNEKKGYKPPGLVTRSMNPDVVMMICTAGHVDHGKTQLVGLLTGCNTDRLKEEIERGMSIELGFAPCYLGNNLSVGIVDVPGHEKFVKNMVAGVSGIEMTILVIAADDGIMPQTIEHLHIMELLGVRKGIVALTKIDLATRERIEKLTREIRDFLKGTFLEGAPICPVSSVTLDGYDQFYNTLVETIKGITLRKRSGIFRMPVERVFSSRGFGVVATGIPVDGTIRLGQSVELVPGNQIGRVRGIQRFLRDTDQGGFGQCLALNIPDFNRKSPERGQTLCEPGYLKPARIFHLLIKSLPGLQKPPANAEEIKFHTGTIEQNGKLYILESHFEDRGGSAIASVVLDELAAAAVGDRIIIRRPSPAETIAGGEIIDITYTPARPRKTVILEKLKTMLSFYEGIDASSDQGQEKKIEYFLQAERKTGGTVQEISKTVLLPEGIVRERLSSLVERGRALSLAGDFFMDAASYESLLEQVKKQITGDQAALSLVLEDLRAGLRVPEPLWKSLEKDLMKQDLAIRRGHKLILRGASEKFEQAEQALMNQVLDIFQKTGFQSPRPDELASQLMIPTGKIDRILEHLCNTRKLIQLDKKVFLSADYFLKAQEMAVKEISEKGILNSADFKYFIGSSRKYALAILDYLDAIGVTMRIGNDRKLAPNFKEKLFRV